MKPTLSVIIPVYNEERTVSSIVEIVRTWGKASEIIVVNDGSTDKTDAALQQFKNTISLLSYKTNRGKGYALFRGVEKCKGEIVMFLDGDVVGLTHKDLDAMMRPVVGGKADMVIGVARFWGVGSFEPFNDVSGERVLYRNVLLPHLAALRHADRGAEFLINDLHKTKRILSVRLAHVYILGKMEKQPIPAAMLEYVKEAKEFLVQIVKLQTNDLTPQAKRVFRVAQSYINKALDYLQFQ